MSEDRGPVPWQLQWRPDLTAVSRRDPQGFYRIHRLSEISEVEDLEVELVLPDDVTYVGIFADEDKAKAAAEYHELTGKPPIRDHRPRTEWKKLLILLAVIWLLYIVGIGLQAWLHGPLP